MCLCGSVLLWQLCGDFTRWPTEYLNYCSQWPFIWISDLLRCVTMCLGSASGADTSAHLPSGLSYSTFWFKILYFSMGTTEAQYLACLHICENDDWNKRPHITVSEATYEYLKILCPEMWALLGGEGTALEWTVLSLPPLVWEFGHAGSVWQQGWKKVAGPCCLFIVNTGDIWNWLHISAVTGFLLHRCANLF